MGRFSQLNFGLTSVPPVPTSTKMAVSITPDALMQSGLNLPVEISTASMHRAGANPPPLTSITVMGHFDTGATRTSIDIELARHLGLTPKGESLIRTANGPVKMPDFIINLGIVGSNLSGFTDLKIGSCTLQFDLKKSQEPLMNPRNFGILLGRDIMSRWHIVWDGPSSSVFIYD